MEELKEKTTDETVIKNKPSGSHFLGILGAILGGFIAAIPWILIYVYGNMIFAALSILIAVGALKGYQILKGPIDKSLPFVIAIVSLLTVVIVTLVIIPCLLMVQEDIPLTMDYFKIIYSNNEFVSGIMQDLIISIIFTILGISGVIVNINRQLKQSGDSPLEQITISSALANPNIVNESITSVKDVFQKYEAMDKYHTIDKETILRELESLPNGKQLFNTLKMQQIIRKSRNQYYFSEKAEQNGLYRFGILFGKIALVILLITIILFTVIFLSDMDTKKDPALSNTLSNSDSASNTYTFRELNMKVIVPNDMEMITGSALDYVFGSGASEYYDFAAYNTNDMITGFSTGMSDEPKEEYMKSLKESFEKTDYEYTLVSDYKEENISGFNFHTIEYQLKDDEGVLYNDLCMLYFADKKMIFIEYSYLAEKADQVKEQLPNLITQLYN